MTDTPNQALRIVHHIVIGVDRSCADHHIMDGAYDALKEGITRLSGGLVAFITDGTWTAGSETGDYLSGPVEQDIALNFIVTLTYDEENSGAWEAVKHVIAKTVQAHSLKCHHIHVAIWAAQAGHFHVCDVIPANDNAPVDHQSKGVAS